MRHVFILNPVAGKNKTALTLRGKIDAYFANHPELEYSIRLTDGVGSATRIAEENAVKNGLPEGKMDVFCGNVLTDKDFWDKFAKEEYDIILANIVADIISDMLPLFDSCLKNDGRMVCSGIISPRKEFVLEALKNNGF